MSGNYGMKRGFITFWLAFLNQIITIALGSSCPRLVLVSFGSEVNGLVNSITQIFVYFSFWRRAWARLPFRRSMACRPG